MKFWDKAKTWFSKKLAVTVAVGLIVIVVSGNEVFTICLTALGGWFVYCQHKVDIAKVNKEK